MIFPPFFGGSRGASIVSFTTGTGTTIARPDNVAAGDVLVLAMSSVTSQFVAAAPSGFTSRADSGIATRARARIATKVATSSEPSSYTMGTDARCAVMLCVRSVNDAPQIASAFLGRVASGSNAFTVPAFTASTAGALILPIFTGDFSGPPASVSTPPAGLQFVARSESTVGGPVSANIYALNPSAADAKAAQDCALSARHDAWAFQMQFGVA